MAVIVEDNLNRYKHINLGSYFCKSSYTIDIKKKDFKI